MPNKLLDIEKKKKEIDKNTTSGLELKINGLVDLLIICRFYLEVFNVKCLKVYSSH